MELGFYLATGRAEYLDAAHALYRSPLYEWIAATAPTSRLMEIAVLLEKAVPNAVKLTALALQLHEYQYNGPDPEGMRSKIPDNETAARLIATFIARLKAVLLSHKGAGL